HPLRIARAVHHACTRLDPAVVRTEHERRTGLGLSPSVQAPALAGDDVQSRPATVPVTMVEAGDHEDELFGPFSRWLIPVPARQLAASWLANACIDPTFGELFNDIVTFRDENSELYTVELPESMRGTSWRELRRMLFTAQGRAGIVPIGIYRGHAGR